MTLSLIAIPFIVLSVFWGFVGLVVPLFFLKSKYFRLIQLMLLETAAVCYLFWVLTYLMQLNPLIGPQLSNDTVLILQHEWGYYDWSKNPHTQH